MMRKTAFLWAFLIAFSPLWAHALGLGDIQLFSALNQPLDAKIPLRALQSGDLDSLKVTLGDDAQFERAGLERPFHLSRLRFKVVAEQGDSGHLKVTTKDPVIEPFLNFLVDVSWSRGRVLREYTILLDPPVYGAAIASTVERTVPTVASEPAVDRVQGVTPTTSGMGTPAESSVGPAGSGEYGATTSTDTLWSLAQRFRPGTGVSMQQMMLAMVRANPHAFVDGNVNTLRAGVVLRIPDRDALAATSQADALAEVRRQHAVWEGYRQALSGSGAAMPVEPVAREADAGLSPGVVSQPPDGEPKLKLVSPGSATQGVGGDTQAQAQELDQLREELLRTEEEADARKRENDSLELRLSDAETNIADLQRLLELKEDSLAALQRRLVEAESRPVVAPAPEPDDSPGLGVEPQKEPEPTVEAPPPKPKPVPVPPPPADPSMMDTITGVMDSLPVDPVILGGGLGGGLLVVLGVVMWLRKRRDGGEKVVMAGARNDINRHELTAELDDEETQMRGDDDRDDETALPDHPIADEDDEDDDVTQMASSGAQAASSGDEPTEMPPAARDDPLAEVNVYLAYERFEQAAELVNKAIAEHPDRHEYKLKMLEIHYAAKNTKDFKMAAQVLQAAVGDEHPHMETARGWWNEMSPGRDLFGDDGDTADDGDDIFDISGDEGIDTVHTPGKTSTGEGTVDFDLGFDDEMGSDPAGTGTGTSDVDLDFDLGFGDVGEGSTDDELEGLDTEVLDFSLEGFATDAPETTPEDGSGSLDFDLNFGEADADDGEGTEVSTTTDLPNTEDLSGTEIDFDLDFGSGDDVTELPAAHLSGTAGADTAQGDGGGLDLDLGIAADGEKPEPRPANRSWTEKTAPLLPGGVSELDAEEVAVEDFGIEPLGTGDLDLDLGFDGSATDSLPGADAGDELELDFELEIPGGDEPSTDDPLAAASSDTDPTVDLSEIEELGLDLDLNFPEEDAIEEDDVEMDEIALQGGANGAEEEISLDLDSEASLELDFGLDDGESEDLEEISLDLGEFSTEGSVGDPVGLDLATELELPSEEDTVDEREEGLDLDVAELGEDSDELEIVGDDTEFTLTDVSLALGGDSEGNEEEEDTIILGGTVSGDIDEVQTKLDLARAYIDMQDTDGARAILEEVEAEGTQAQKNEAAELLSNIS